MQNLNNHSWLNYKNTLSAVAHLVILHHQPIRHRKFWNIYSLKKFLLAVILKVCEIIYEKLKNVKDSSKQNKIISIAKI